MTFLAANYFSKLFDFKMGDRYFQNSNSMLFHSSLALNGLKGVFYWLHLLSIKPSSVVVGPKKLTSWNFSSCFYLFPCYCLLHWLKHFQNFPRSHPCLYWSLFYLQFQNLHHLNLYQIHFSSSHHQLQHYEADQSPFH